MSPPCSGNNSNLEDFANDKLRQEWTTESDRVCAARDLGMGDYLRKPYVAEKLGMAVKNEIGRSLGTRAD